MKFYRVISDDVSEDGEAWFGTKQEALAAARECEIAVVSLCDVGKINRAKILRMLNNRGFVERQDDILEKGMS